MCKLVENTLKNNNTFKKYNLNGSVSKGAINEGDVTRMS